jgi:hypothetical protein
MLAVSFLHIFELANNSIEDNVSAIRRGLGRLSEQGYERLSGGVFMFSITV